MQQHRRCCCCCWLPRLLLFHHRKFLKVAPPSPPLSPPQAAAYRALAPGAGDAAPHRHVVLADHAGSGKTLAYLLPLLQLLKAEEKLLGGVATQPSCPRLVLVVPTAELAAQVLRVTRALARAGGAAAGLRVRSAAFTGGRPARTQREALEGGVDVAVGTPGRLAELLREGALRLDFCRAVVCDEVDVLLGELAFCCCFFDGGAGMCILELLQRVSGCRGKRPLVGPAFPPAAQFASPRRHRLLSPCARRGLFFCGAGPPAARRCPRGLPLGVCHRHYPGAGLPRPGGG